MGISEKNRFHGYNHLPTNPLEEEKYPLIDENEHSKRMTISAQILSIAENYITYKKKIGGKDAIKRMISGTGRLWNGPIFDIFFFQVVPEKDIPDILVDLKYSYKGSKLLIRDINGGKEFYIIGKNKKPRHVSLDEIKQGLRLGDY